MRTSKQIFKALFSEARKAFPHATGSNRPFNAVMRAESVLIHDRDFPISETVTISRAAIYALHWTRGNPSPDVPRNRSEIHRCFSLGPNESRVWFTSPADMLPA